MTGDNENNNVIPLTQPDKLILLCNECKCPTFNLVANGTMECAYCNAVVHPETSTKWAERVPAPTQDIGEPEKVSNNVMGNATYARKRVMRELNKWADTATMVLVIGYSVDGYGHSWLDIDTEEQREWILKKIDDLKEYVATEIQLNVAHTVNYLLEEEADANEQEPESTTQVEHASEQAPAPDTGEGGTGNSGDASGG
jgi:uncharacterized Zn finger protein (UPF0148 family)